VDPVSHAWHKASQCRRYKTHKERGSVKLISTMTSREIRHQRSMSVVRKTAEVSTFRQHKHSEAYLTTAKKSVVLSCPTLANSDSWRRGRRKMRKDRALQYRKIARIISGYWPTSALNAG